MERGFAIPAGQAKVTFMARQVGANTRTEAPRRASFQLASREKARKRTDRRPQGGREDGNAAPLYVSRIHPAE